MNAHDLDQIDPTLIDGQAVPEEFIAEHFAVAELAELLNMDMDTLFTAVAGGLVPRPIVLPVEPPMPVWNARIIQAWLEAGAPVDENYITHQRVVLDRLFDTIRDSLSENPPSIDERN